MWIVLIWRAKVVFVIFLDASVISHKHKLMHTYSNKHKHTYKHINTQTCTHYHYNQVNVEIWQVLRIQVDSPFKKGWVVFVIFLLPPYTVNMTLSPSLNANGRQLGSSELVISHCLLCPVKLSTEFCMITMTFYEKTLEVPWWVLCLGRSRGQNPRGLRPLGFWPWDLPRHNIHHGTSSAFSNNVPLYTVNCTHCTRHAAQCYLYGAHYIQPAAHITLRHMLNVIAV